MATTSRSRRWILPVVVVLLWLFIGGPLSTFAGKLAEVQQNDNAAFLPQSAESTEVLEEFVRFTGQESIPATVVFERTGGLTAGDRQAIGAYAEQLRQVPYVDADSVNPPTYSDDGEAAQLVVPIVGSDGDQILAAVGDIRDVVADPPDGLLAAVGGQGGVLGDFIEAFGGIDGVLLVVALVVVLLILLVVYRSPVLPFAVLFAALLGLGVASAAIYALADHDVLDLNGQSQGILFILAIGASTDYSLLLVARFREELRDQESKYDAMRSAWRGAVEPIVASGLTVILGLLCLLLSDLSSLQGLGPVGALGVAAAMLSSLTFLPMLLVLLGRNAFWPFRPAYGSEHAEVHGIWGKVARLVGRRAKILWPVTFVLLAGFAAFLPTLNEKPVPQTETFLTDVDSVKAQDVLDRHFDADQGSPALITVPQSGLEPTLALAAAHPGVAENGVTYLPATQPEGADPPPEGADPPPEGADPPPESAAPPPKIIDGDALVLVTLSDPADSAAATDTVEDLRVDLDEISPEAKVGGSTAILLDTRQTVDRDRAEVIPAILVVIFIVLALLLRSLLAPAVLLVANVLSFGATMGISALLFNHVFDFPGADPTITLISFVFLVALGIDYSIFLMTRVREESVRQGTHPGVLKGLSVTGGVITSAGVVLAATFAALSVLPLLFLVQIAFIVAFGVLLDTFVVRTLLVPAVAYHLGPVVWWPSKLWHSPDHPDAGTSEMLQSRRTGGRHARR